MARSAQGMVKTSLMGLATAGAAAACKQPATQMNSTQAHRPAARAVRPSWLDASGGRTGRVNDDNTFDLHWCTAKGIRVLLRSGRPSVCAKRAHKGLRRTFGRAYRPSTVNERDCPVPRCVH